MSNEKPLNSPSNVKADTEKEEEYDDNDYYNEYDDISISRTKKSKSKFTSYCQKHVRRVISRHVS